MTTAPADLPVDETSRAALEQQGLAMRVVDASDDEAFAPWHRGVSRGFHGPEPTPERLRQAQEQVRGDRLVGVYDPSSPEPAVPVATSEGWVADLTLPGGRALPAWAVSEVTVSQTHRRRGIARAMLEAELRTAVALDLPMAMLTVSEATIYRHFGFGPAAFARDVRVDTRRARWVGPRPAGRLHHVTGEQLVRDGHAVVERVRLRSPGAVAYDVDSVLWRRQVGLGVDDAQARATRLVRYDDADGRPQGFAAYQVVEDEADFTQHTAKVTALVAATDDAYAALWRYVLELDLVSTVTAHLRPVDEPLRWMVDDFRAVHVDEVDHLWTRILDVPRSLEARTYDRPGRVVLTVTDDLGPAAGTFALHVADDGTAEVTPTDEPADVTLPVDALASVHLGGVPARALQAAGRLAGDADRLDATFRSPVAPWLAIWF